MARASSLSPPGMWRLTSLRTLPTSVVCAPKHCQARASLFTASFHSAVNKDRYGLRGDRVIESPLTPLPTQAPQGGSVRVIPSLRKLPALHSWLPTLHTIFGLFRSRFSPLPLLRRGGGTLHFIANPKPPLAFPACQCRDAALLPPVGARRQPPHSSPPAGVDALAIQPVGYLFVYGDERDYLSRRARFR